MRQTIVVLFALLCLCATIYAQQSAFTENAYNKYKHYNTAGVDSFITTANTAFLVSLTFNTCVASDTVIIRNGLDTVAAVKWGATAPTAFTLFYNTQLDTSLIVTRKGTTDFLLTYRRRR